MELYCGDLASIRGLYSCGKGCVTWVRVWSEKHGVWDIPEDARAARLLGHSLVAFAYQPCAVVGQQAFLSCRDWDCVYPSLCLSCPAQGLVCSSPVTIHCDVY